MKPAAFDYHVPAEVDEAVDLLGELGDEAKVLAGGQSLVPMLALRLAVFDHLVDLRGLAGLRGIEERDGRLWIGARTTQAEIGRSPHVAEAAPLLTRATPLIGHFQIRNRGTIGGSLAHADTAAEYPAVALALDAEIEARSPSGTRTIPATGFFTDIYTTDLAPDELLTGISFPVRGERCGHAIEEFARRRGDFAVAGTAVAVELDESSRVRRCAIAVLGLGPTPCRVTRAEDELTGAAVADIEPQEVGRLAMAELDAIPADLHGSAGYRRRIGVTVTARAWRRAAEEAAR